MGNLIRKLGTRVALVLLLTGALSTVASASGYWPGHRRGGGGHGGGYSVAEPAAVLLLGAGLVSLGLYAKRKRGKK